MFYYINQPQTTFFPIWLVKTQRSEFALAVSNCWGFCWGITIFFSICLGKNIAEAIEFLRLKKNTFPRIKKIGLKKRNVVLNKKIIFVFPMIFKLHCITQIIYFIIHICLYLYSLFILLQETGHRKNTNPSLLIQVAKIDKKNEEKSRGISVWVLNMYRVLARKSKLMTFSLNWEIRFDWKKKLLQPLACWKIPSLLKSNSKQDILNYLFILTSQCFFFVHKINLDLYYFTMFICCPFLKNDFLPYKGI